jgi:hypothetical protein
VFNDVHAAMAFVAAGHLDDARALVARLKQYAGTALRPSVANVAMTSEVGLPVCEAIVAFGEERYDDVVDALHPIRAVVHRLGGSNAQRDAVARTLLEGAVRSGRLSLARALVSERLAVKEASPYYRKQLARVQDGDRASTVTAV